MATKLGSLARGFNEAQQRGFQMLTNLMLAQKQREQDMQDYEQKMQMQATSHIQQKARELQLSEDFAEKYAPQQIKREAVKKGVIMGVERETGEKYDKLYHDDKLIRHLEKLKGELDLETPYKVRVAQAGASSRSNFELYNQMRRDVQFYVNNINFDLKTVDSEIKELIKQDTAFMSEDQKRQHEQLLSEARNRRIELEMSKKRYEEFYTQVGQNPFQEKIKSEGINNKPGTPKKKLDY